MEGDEALRKRFADEVRARCRVVPVEAPAWALVMLTVRETARNSLFHPGEVLVSRAKVQVDGALGYGLVTGDRLRAAEDLALIDGAWNSGCPLREGVPEPEAAALAGMEVFLTRICSCRIDDPGRAAFLFLPKVPQGSGVGTPSPGAPAPGRAVRAVEEAFRGSFMDPHQGATVLVEVERLCHEPPGGAPGAGTPRSWILEGPGVNGSSALACGPGDAEFLRGVLAARGRACSEFPLGVDLVILDREGHVVCLPRTTTVRES